MLKTSSKALLWVCLVFLVGAGFGGIITSVLVRPREVVNGDNGGDRPFRSRTPRPAEAIIRRMARHLELDPQQVEELRLILEESREKQKQLERHRSEEQRRIRRQTLMQIRLILRPDQVDKLDGFLKRLGRRERRDRLKDAR